MGVIYSITNPKGQVYVGETKNFDNRIKLHLKDSKKNKKSNFLLYISVNTYGWINHTFSVIEEVENSLLKQREAFWIEELKSYAYEHETGLNMVLKGHHKLKERKKYIKKKSLKKKEGGNQKNGGKKVVVYSLDGNYVGDFSSCRQASLKLGIKEGDAGRVARVRQKAQKITFLNSMTAFLI